MLIWVDPGFIRVDLLDRGERCLYDRGSPRWSRPVWQGGCASCTQRRLRTGRVPVPWRQTMGEANENSQLELLDTIGRIQKLGIFMDILLDQVGDLHLPKRKLRPLMPNSGKVCCKSLNFKDG